MEEQPVPGPAPSPDPTSGSPYDQSIGRLLKKPGGKDESPPTKSEEMKNQEAQSRKPPAPSGNPA